MMSAWSEAIPTWETFRDAPDEQIAAVAPQTAVFSAGGTRRAAALAGIAANRDDYAVWAREQNLRTFDLLFRHGVQHIIAAAITQNQLNETTPIYRERLLQWTAWGMSGSEALTDYKRLGWKVRLLGTEYLPDLQDCADQLQTSTLHNSDKNVWWFVAPKPDSYWDHLLQVMKTTQAQTRTELIQALYGEVIPLATLFIAYGKPLIMPEQIPPLLMGTMQCYWLQRPGYLTDVTLLRQILYDFAFLRPTWQQDKTERAEEIITQAAMWQQMPTVGLGKRSGSFWLPRTIEDGDW